MKVIGEQIKQRRQELGITQPHLALLSEISVNTLYKIERGRSNPTVSTLAKIAEVLGLEVKLTVKTPEQLS